MIERTQIFLVVVVCAAGLALWATRHRSNENQPSSATPETIVERTAPAGEAPAAKPFSPPTAAPTKQHRPAAGPIDATDATFSSLVLGSDKPVLVDFGAEWCGACRILEPVIHELAGELSGEAVVAQVDVDANPALAAEYGIRALPTLLIFKDGQVVDKVVGVAAKNDLRAKINAQSGGPTVL